MDLLRIKSKTIKLTTMTAAVAMLALGATPAMAQVNGGQANGTVDATVVNVVTVTETTPMTFGTIVIITSGAVGNLDAVMTSAGVVTWPGVAGNVAPWVGALGNGLGDGGGGNTNPRIFPTGATAAAAGVYDITLGAFGASMGVIYNNSTVGDNTFANASSTLASPCAGNNLLVGDWTDNSVGGIITLNGAGAFTLNVGGTLRADNAVGNNTNPNGTAGPFAGAYCDGIYSGPLIVSAVY